MKDDKTRDRSCTVSAESTGPSERAPSDRSVPVLGAYDAVKGTDSFVLAAADRDDAWLAVGRGGERALEEWR